jgi:hypothetical protein
MNEVSMSPSTPGVIKNHAAFIWSVADLLRGDYKQSEYGKVILPLTVIRRLDCVLEPTKPKVLAVHRQYGDRNAILRAASARSWLIRWEPRWPRTSVPPSAPSTEPTSAVYTFTPRAFLLTPESQSTRTVR